MNSRSVRRALACAVSASMLVCLCACGFFTRAPEQSVGQAPTPVNVNDVMRHENALPSVANVYFAAEEAYSLRSEQRQIGLSPGESFVHGLVSAVLGMPERSELKPVAPAGVRCLSVEVSGDIATVNLSHEALKADEYGRYMLRMAILYTLTEHSAIRWVSVLVGGVALPWQHLPVGPMTRENKDLLTIHKDREGELLRIQQSVPELARNIYNVALYFPDITGRYLVPEVRSVEVRGRDALDCVYAVLDELSRGPLDSDSKQKMFLQHSALMDMGTYLPSGSIESGLYPKVSMVVDSNGVLSLQLVLTAYGVQYFSHTSLSESMFYGAIALSLFGIMPDLSTISFAIDNNEVKSLDGVPIIGGLTRAHFEGLVGAFVDLHVPSEGQNALTIKRRAMPQASANEPREVLKELFLLPEEEFVTSRVLPYGVTDLSQVIAGVYVDGDLVNIDLSEELGAACAHLGPREERMFVYSIVNTMSELSGIKRVRLFFGGKTEETLAGRIDIHDPLVKAPGLVIHSD